jgi:hypothetical protein
MIGRERLRLHEPGISFQRTRTWKESTDGDRNAKLDRIEYVTSACPDRCFASDQFGPLSIRPCHGVCRAPRKRPAPVTPLAALRSIRAARPDGYRLFVICGNLAADKTPAIRRWARRENAGLCFTPTSASRANPIEAQSGPVRIFVMGGSDHRNHLALARKLQACLRWRVRGQRTRRHATARQAPIPLPVRHRKPCGSHPGTGHNLTRRAGVPASRHRLASDGASWLACQK